VLVRARQCIIHDALNDVYRHARRRGLRSVRDSAKDLLRPPA